MKPSRLVAWASLRSDRVTCVRRSSDAPVETAGSFAPLGTVAQPTVEQGREAAAPSASVKERARTRPCEPCYIYVLATTTTPRLTTYHLALVNRRASPLNPGQMSAAVSSTKAIAGPFIRSRLGSFLAVVPLGIWTLNHLWNNLSAFSGAAKWQTDVTEYSHPLAFFATATMALLPLGLHTIWGISRLFTARVNVGNYRYFANAKYVLQRASAVGVLLFLGAHLWLAFLHPRLTTGRPEPFSDISHEMHHHGPTLMVYVLGVLGVSYHLANGLQTFTMGWGIVQSRRALRKLEVGVIVFFLVLLAMGWSAIYALWDAGR